MVFRLIRAQNLMAVSEQAYFTTPDMNNGNFGSTNLRRPISIFRSNLDQTSLTTISPPTGSFTDTEGIVVSNTRGDVVVAFRGSETPGSRRAPTGGIQDWVVTDAFAIKVPYPKEIAAFTPDVMSSRNGIIRALLDSAIQSPSMLVHAGFCWVI